MGGAGGARAVLLEGPANCLLLCHRCHRWVERFRAEAFAAGWLVALGDDPAAAPALVRGRGLVLLGEDYARPGLPLPARAVPPGSIPVTW